MIDADRIPLALYVHLPWCVRKCPYCDFNSHALPAAGLPEGAYLAALLDDLDHAAAEAAGREIVSVFFGGGTPSLFSGATIGAVLERARALLPLAPDVEVTLEANPGTIERGRFETFAQAGVNRVSLGAQSFDDAALQRLGRIHLAGDIERAVHELRHAGIHNFNLDLMYALPGQDLAGALADVRRALALGPTHVSHYQLTLEPDTPFARRPPPGLPQDDLALEMQEACQAALAAAGYAQYEVSAYARPGRRCRHNLVYWQFGDYLGVGAGAHGKLSRGGRVERTARVRHPAEYLTAIAPAARLAERREVAERELPFEFMLNALRLVDGFEERDFTARTGSAAPALAVPLRRAVHRGLITGRDGHWAPTPLGLRFLTDLQAEFLPE
ncbi:MAG: radical SAM family heme chaperone HemW [Steroidobacteraceae bacterium]